MKAYSLKLIRHKLIESLIKLNLKPVVRLLRRKYNCFYVEFFCRTLLSSPIDTLKYF